MPTRRSFLIMVVTAGCAISASPALAAGGLDPAFMPPRINASVQTVAARDTGSVLIGGTFSNAGGDPRIDRVARLLSSGDLDRGFRPPALLGGVYTAIALPSGKYLVGGDFTDAGGDRAADHLIRLNRDGSLDTGFRAPAFGAGFSTVSPTRVLSVKKVPGGYLVGGDFTSVAGDPTRASLVKLRPDGSLDSGFVPPAIKGPVRSLFRSGGAYLVAGDFTEVGGNQALDRVVRLQPTGSLDPTFVPPPLNGPVSVVAAGSDGKPVIAGDFTDLGGDPDRDRVARLTSTGALDPGFRTPVFNAGVKAVLPDRQGYLVGGAFTDLSGKRKLAGIARLTNDGSADPAFRPVRIAGTVNAVVRAQARFLVGGDFRKADRQTQFKRVVAVFR